MLVLEQSLILAEISCKLTLDAKEWERLLYCQGTINMVVLARVASLSSMLFPMLADVISISHALRFRNSENFAKHKDHMEGAYSVR